MSVFRAIGTDRLRVTTDGEGVTTLVAGCGCPLRCAYCLNPQCFAPDFCAQTFTPQELYEQVKKDAVYFVATGGGLTFGGGEPLLQTEFIAAFREIADRDWRFTAETCLNVPRQTARRALALFDRFIIDIKDMDPGIYRRYTGRDNAQVKENLALFAAAGRAADCTVRLPLIPGYNTGADRERSRRELEAMGFSRFDPFPYVVRKGKQGTA